MAYLVSVLAYNAILLLLKRKPCMAVIQVGNNEASNIYIKSKEKFANELGCKFNHIKSSLCQLQKGRTVKL